MMPVLQALAAHAAFAGYLHAHRAMRFLTQATRIGKPNPTSTPLPVPSLLNPLNPAPTPPPGLSDPVGTILAWGKWGVLACGVAGLLMCGGKMAIGHRNRAAFAADGATGIPWVLAGLSLAAVAAAIVGVFL